MSTRTAVVVPWRGLARFLGRLAAVYLMAHTMALAVAVLVLHYELGLGAGELLEWAPLILGSVYNPAFITWLTPAGLGAFVVFYGFALLVVFVLPRWVADDDDVVDEPAEVAP